MAEPRVLVVGAGLAGVLLARRLQDAGAEVVLVGTGRSGPSGGYADATAASGGLVRAFEPEPAARALAAASLAELLGDPDLAAAARWQRTGSLYLLDPRAASGAAATTDAAAGTDTDAAAGTDTGAAAGTGAASGSAVGAGCGVAAGLVGAEVLAGPEVARRFGIHGLPEHTVGVWEHQAGYIVPDRLRRAVLSGLTRTEAVPMARLDGGTVELRDGRRLTGDHVVVAAGPWTPGLLRAAGMTSALRTKHIQYAHHTVARNDLPCFVDETSGLYGRPAGTGRLLLGLPTGGWDVDPAAPEPDAELAARVRAVAALRLPGLDPRPVGPPVSAADCYSTPAGLALRAVTGTVHTFTGGSGGAAKTVLAASRLAASALLDHPSSVDVPTDHPEAER